MVMNEACQTRRLQDEDKRNKHKLLIKTCQTRRLQDEEKRNKQKLLNEACQTRRLQNEEKRAKHILVNKIGQRRRLQDEFKRQRHRAINRKNQLSRSHIDKEYCLKSKLKKTRRLERKEKSAGQQYWIRRRKLLMASLMNRKRLIMETKMSEQSAISRLDVKLMFNRAEQLIRKGEAKVRQQHNKLSSQAEECLTNIPDDRAPTESDIDKAFDELRLHNSSGEPYFYELSYNMLTVLADQAIPIDNTGKLRIFEHVVKNKTTNKDQSDCASITSTTNQNLEQTEDTDSKSFKNWHCHAKLCAVAQDSINGTVRLLQGIVSSKPSEAREFYKNIDSCKFKSSKLGHSVHCTFANGCSSLLRPASTLSCHHPRLRSMIRRLYETIQLINQIDAVRRAMSSKEFLKLKEEVLALDELIKTLTIGDRRKDDENTEIRTATAVEKDMLKI